MVFLKEDKILIWSLRELKDYGSARFLRQFKTKNVKEDVWIICWRKLTEVDWLIVWRGLAAPIVASTLSNPVYALTFRTWILTILRADLSWQLITLLNKPHLNLPCANSVTIFFVANNRLNFSVRQKFGTCVFHEAVRCHGLGEVENVYTVYNYSHFAIHLPKLIKIGANLTKFWQKQKCTVFF